MNNLTLESKIEGILFYKGEEMSVWKLGQLLSVAPEEIDQALIELAKSLESRGMVLLRKGSDVLLGINPGLSTTIEAMRKDEITRELSKASLETLSIILYKNDNEESGVTRSEIDYIRGVNSSFILRNLLVRGLIEKTTDKNDSRRLIYKPTFDTLSYLGITKISDLPNYDKVKKELEDASNIMNQNPNE